ncbi:MAG: CHASE2 domain-containing protein, partial [Hyphococcus sp.]
MAKRMFRGKFEWLSALPLLLVTAVLAVMALGALTGAQSPDARAREALFSFFQRLSPAQYDPEEDFHVVLIDRESVADVGPWPWPRTVLADLVDAAAAAGAKGVIVTEPMDSPDPLSPDTIGDFWLAGASDEALAAQLARLPRTDAALARAFAETTGAVGVAATAPPGVFRSARYRRTSIGTSAWLTLNAAEDHLALPETQYFHSLSEDLASAARPSVAALPLDADGVLRRTPLLWSVDGAPAPALALEAARIAAGAEQIEAAPDRSAASSQGRLLGGVRIGENALDLSPSGVMRLYLPKRVGAPATSAARLLNQQGSNSQLDGKVVLIGLDAGMGSVARTARGAMPPVTLNAIAAAQIKAGVAPRRPGWTGYLEAVAVMLLGAAAVMTAQRMDFWQTAGFAAIISVLLVMGAFAAFALGGVLINPLGASLALFVGALSVAGGRSIGGALLDDSVRGSFHDALPEPVMKKVREGGASELLEGVHREITVLACDLRIMDDDLRKMENLPDDVTKLLAAASLDLRQTILATGGAADQADGGRIFAYYNAPEEKADHMQAACAAALRLVESMDKINADLDSSSRTRGIQINLAIGVATG